MNQFFVVLGGKWSMTQDVNKCVYVLGSVDMGKQILKDVHGSDERNMRETKKSPLAQTQVKRYSIQNVEYIVHLRTSPPGTGTIGGAIGGRFRASASTPGSSNIGGREATQTAAQMETQKFQGELIQYLEMLTVDNLFFGREQFWSDEANRNLTLCESHRLFWIPHSIGYDAFPRPRLLLRMDAVFFIGEGQSFPHDSAFLTMFRAIPRVSPKETHDLLRVIGALTEAATGMGPHAVVSTAFGNTHAGAVVAAAAAAGSSNRARYPEQGPASSASSSFSQSADTMVRTIVRDARRETEIRALAHRGTEEEKKELEHVAQSRATLEASFPRALSCVFELWEDQRLALNSMLEMETEAQSAWTRTLLLPLNSRKSCFFLPNMFKTEHTSFVPKHQLDAQFDAIQSRGGFFTGKQGKVAVLAQLILRRPFCAGELAHVSQQLVGGAGGSPTSAAAAAAAGGGGGGGGGGETMMYDDVSDDMVQWNPTGTMMMSAPNNDVYHEGVLACFPGHGPARSIKPANRRCRIDFDTQAGGPGDASSSLRCTRPRQKRGPTDYDSVIIPMRHLAVVRSSRESRALHNLDPGNEISDLDTSMQDRTEVPIETIAHEFGADPKDPDDYRECQEWKSPDSLFDPTRDSTDADNAIVMSDDAEPASSAASTVRGASGGAASGSVSGKQAPDMPLPVAPPREYPGMIPHAPITYSIPLQPGLHQSNLHCITSTLVLVPNGEKNACRCKLNASAHTLVVQKIDEVMRPPLYNFDTETIRRWNSVDVVVATYEDFIKFTGKQQDDVFRTIHWWRVVFYHPERCDHAIMSSFFPGAVGSAPEAVKHLHITHRWICMDTIADLFRVENLLQQMCVFLSLSGRMPASIEHFIANGDPRAIKLSHTQTAWFVALLRHSLVCTDNHAEIRQKRIHFALEQRILILSMYLKALESMQALREPQKGAIAVTAASAALAATGRAGSEQHRIRRVRALLGALREKQQHAKQLHLTPLCTRPRMIVHHYLIPVADNAMDWNLISRLRLLRIGVLPHGKTESDPLTEADLRFHLSVAAGCPVKETRRVVHPRPLAPATAPSTTERSEHCVICSLTFDELEKEDKAVVQIEEKSKKNAAPGHHVCRHVFCRPCLKRAWAESMTKKQNSASYKITCPNRCPWADQTKLPPLRQPWFKGESAPKKIPDTLFFQSTFEAASATQQREFVTLQPFAFPSGTYMEKVPARTAIIEHRLETRVEFMLRHLAHLVRTAPETPTLVVGSTCTLQSMFQYAIKKAPPLENRNANGILIQFPPGTSPIDTVQPTAFTDLMDQLVGQNRLSIGCAWDEYYEKNMLQFRRQTTQRSFPLLWLNTERIPDHVTVPMIRHVVILDAIMELNDLTFGSRQCETSVRLDRLFARHSRDTPLRVERFVTRDTLEFALFESIARDSAAASGEPSTSLSLGPSAPTASKVRIIASAEDHIRLHTDSLTDVWQPHRGYNPTSLFDDMLTSTQFAFDDHALALAPRPVAPPPPATEAEPVHSDPAHPAADQDMPALE
jgi:hypothetical protein